MLLFLEKYLPSSHTSFYSVKLQIMFTVENSHKKKVNLCPQTTGGLISFFFEHIFIFEKTQNVFKVRFRGFKTILAKNNRLLACKTNLVQSATHHQPYPYCFETRSDKEKREASKHLYKQNQ